LSTRRELPDELALRRERIAVDVEMGGKDVVGDAKRLGSRRPGATSRVNHGGDAHARACRVTLYRRGELHRSDLERLDQNRLPRSYEKPQVTAEDSVKPLERRGCGDSVLWAVEGIGADARRPADRLQHGT